jgi:hypothetical protein
MAEHIDVRLTDAEVRICTWVGRQRFANAMEHARDNGKGPSLRDRTPALHIQGAMGEFAAAIALNMSWRPTVGQINQPDVGGFVQVRSTYYRDGHLIIKPKDTGPFVLVIYLGEMIRVCGWYEAAIAKREFALLSGSTFDDGYFVPQSALLPLDELRQRRAA